MRGHRVSEVARTRVDDDPHLTGFVSTQFDEVVATAKRMQGPHTFVLQDALHGL